MGPNLFGNPSTPHQFPNLNEQPCRAAHSSLVPEPAAPTTCPGVSTQGCSDQTGRRVERDL